MTAAVLAKVINDKPRGVLEYMPGLVAVQAVW